MSTEEINMIEILEGQRDQAWTAVDGLAAANARLQRRLTAAEQVCILFSWMSPSTADDIGKAVLQAWMDWKHAYDPVAKPAEWRDRIAELARRRDEIRESTLRKIRSKAVSA